METFLALYRGPDVERATVVAVTANPDIITRFSSALLEAEDSQLSHPGSSARDPVEEAVAEGRREALRIVRDEDEGGDSSDG